MAEPACWRCRSLGSYRGLPLTATAFSPDGSVLAVAAGPRLTLWDPISNALAAVLPLASQQYEDHTAQAQAQAAPPKASTSGRPELAAGREDGLTQLTFVPGTPYLVSREPRVRHASLWIV